MPQTMHFPETKVQDLSLLGVFTDYKSICAPYVPMVRDVLEGKANRCKLKFNNTLFVFHHGCLLSRVVHNGRIFSLPPFAFDWNGQPYITALPLHQRRFFNEFLSLPKDVLLFYFTLLKEVFKGYALGCQWEDPATGRITRQPIPAELQAALKEVDWRVSVR